MINMPGGPEVFVIFLVALIVLGPQQLPKAMRTLGSVMAEIRKVSNGFQAEVRNAMDVMDLTVDTSATEKPQSGSMAAVAPGKASTPPASTATADSVIDEVVVRNEGDATETGPIVEGEAPAAGPVIDPVDRAAG